MERQIIINGKKRQQLEKDFNVCRTTVWAALRYKTKGSKADMLRKAALERGGVEIFGNGSEPNIKLDTYWTEVPHQMHQVFCDRVKLIVDVDEGTATIKKDGNPVAIYKDVLMSQIRIIQAKAQEITNDLK